MLLELGDGGTGVEAAVDSAAPVAMARKGLGSIETRLRYHANTLTRPAALLQLALSQKAR